MDIRQLQHRFSQLVRPAPSGQGLSRWEVYLMSDRHANLSPELEVQSPPISSPLFPCRQEKSPWERAQAADFHHTLVYTHVRVPKMTDPRLVSRLAHPVGSGQGAPSFTGPFWRHTGWCLNRHLQGAGGNGIFSVSSSFSVFSVSPMFTSPLILTHYTPTQFILKSYLCLYKLWSLMSLLYVVSSVRQLLQVSAEGSSLVTGAGSARIQTTGTKLAPL